MKAKERINKNENRILQGSRTKCESKRCYFCSYWGISPEEYLEKKETIQKEILEMRNNVSEMTTALQNLNKQFLQDELSRRNPELLTKIKQKQTLYRAIYTKWHY